MVVAALISIAASMGWISIGGWGNVGSGSFWVMSNSGWLVVIDIAGLCLTLVDVVTSILLTVLVGASMSWVALVNIVTIGVRWAISVAWFGISFPLVDVMASILLTVLVGASMSWVALVNIVTIGVRWAISIAWFGISFALVNVMASILLTVLVGASVSWVALVNIVTVRVRWAVSVAWFSISLTLVDRLKWVTEHSSSNIRGCSIWMMSKSLWVLCRSSLNIMSLSLSFSLVKVMSSRSWISIDSSSAVR